MRTLVRRPWRADAIVPGGLLGGAPFRQAPPGPVTAAGPAAWDGSLMPSLESGQLSSLVQENVPLHVKGQRQNFHTMVALCQPCLIKRLCLP